MIICFTEIALLSILICAVMCDFHNMKIPNRLVATGVLLAPIGMGLEIFIENQSVFYLILKLILKILEVLLGFAFLFLCIWPLYQIRALGAGDCKLILMTGVYLPVKTTLLCLGLSLLLGAVFGVCKLFWQQGKRPCTIHFSLSILASAIICLLR